MFGFELPVVFGAGVLSFLSPCVLPLVPAYLTYMSGSTFERLRDEGVAGGQLYFRTVTTALAFVFGFSLIFITLGATATAFGQVFRRMLGAQLFGFPILMTLAGLVIIAMGLHFLGVFRIGWLYRQFRMEGPKMASGPLGGFLLGLAFAVGWTPCIGPVLAAILTVAANQQTAWEGAALLAVYSVGLGVPFLLAALALGPFLSFFEGFKRHLGTVEKVMGGFLVVVGVLFITGNFTRLAFWMQSNFSVLNQFG